MVNRVLGEINQNGWFILFQWQMEDGKLCVLFRRVRDPGFIIPAFEYDENRLYGKAQVDIAWLESFVKENDLEKKWADFQEEMRRRAGNGVQPKAYCSS